MNQAAWGIDSDYVDVRGRRHRAPPETVQALLEAMGAAEESPGRAPVLVLRHGESLDVDAPAELETEDGGHERIDEALPDEMPLGYHRLTDLESGAATRLIVVPNTCFLPDNLFVWGWAVQLYALRSRTSWGMGDLGDLARLNRWAEEVGAGFLLINPLHSVDPFAEQDSPYFPGSRCWRNPLYIDIERVPGARAARAELDPVVRAARALNDERIIRRAEIRRHKHVALELLWRNFSGNDEFEAYKSEAGELLDRFATYLALSEVHGDDWHAWPAGLRHPAAGGIARASRELSDRIGFFRWQQWLLDAQLRESSAPLGVVHDLAVGVNPRGFDAWNWQDVFVPGVSIGAPPDDFNLGGQGWGVMAFDPHKLRASGYEPFIQTVRASLRHAAGLRIDHVMGLWRLFLIPDGAPPAAGTYLRYAASDLLGILCLESHRAGAFVIGEDLGNVEPEVREELQRARALSYRLLYFEDSDPAEWPREALAAVTNHDLPTLPGLWSGADLVAQEAAGIEPNTDFAESARAHIRDLTGLAPSSPASEVVAAVYERLSRTPSRLVAATLEDAMGVVERTNQPGTLDERSNWALALPHSIEEIAAHPAPRRLASLLNRRR